MAAEAWSDAVAPGGYVCAVPDSSRPDGICGNPVESEPCDRHAARLMGRYACFADAVRRLEALKRQGRWPGIITHRDGTCDLTWDPQDAAVTISRY